MIHSIEGDCSMAWRCIRIILCRAGNAELRGRRYFKFEISNLIFKTGRVAEVLPLCDNVFPEFIHSRAGLASREKVSVARLLDWVSRVTSHKSPVTIYESRFTNHES